MSKTKEPTKKIKARVLSNDGDLEFAIIEVPVSDKRPEWKGGALNDGKGAQSGNPMKGKGVEGVFGKDE